MAPAHLAGDAQALIETLGLAPHPEGGHYREIFRDPDPPGGRGAASAIYYLLCAGERSHWHRVDAVEIWQHLAGEALALAVSADGLSQELHTLGKDSDAKDLGAKDLGTKDLGTKDLGAKDLGAKDLGEVARPQLIVPKDAWQSAWPLGAFALVACVVAPAFRFEGFELAPSGWQPGQGKP